VYRLRHAFGLILVILLVQTGCRFFRNSPSGEPTPQTLASAPNAGKALSTAKKGEKIYTLRIVFDGLVTGWERDKSENPQDAWFLLVNGTNPGQFQIGRDVPQHQAELLVKGDVKTSGRSLSPVMPEMLGHHHPQLDGEWRGTSLFDEELILVADTATPLTVIRNKGRLPLPCNPQTSGCVAQAPEEEQRKDLLWTVDLDEVLAKLPQGTADDKQLNPCLLTETYSCPGAPAPLLLSARFHLKNGTVRVGGLEVSGNNNLTKQIFPTVPAYAARALANEIVVDLEVHGPVEFRSRPLTPRGRRKPGLVIDGNAGDVVEVRIGNHPAMDRTEAFRRELFGNDFFLTYNLLKRPGFTEPAELPGLSTDNAGGAFNGQCSPNNMTGNGG
jgi:hypothetical protein